MGDQKLITFLVTILFISMFPETTIAQNSSDQIIVKGNFKNFANEKIYVSSEDFRDSLMINKNGDFLFKPGKIREPQTAYFQIRKKVSFSLFLAPGYDLNLQSDARDQESFFHSLQITGEGAKTNEYWRQYYLLYENRIKPLTDAWYNIPLNKFVKEGLEKPNLDSFSIAISKTIFGPENKDPFKNTFKKNSLEDLTWTKPRLLFQYSYMNDLSTPTIDSLIKLTIPPHLLVSDDRYINNSLYKEVVSFLYLNHLLDKELLVNKSVLESTTKRKLQIADSLYNDLTKDYVLDHVIQSAIGETFSFNELQMLKSFTSKIKEDSLRKDLIAQNEKRKAEIEIISKGKPAPVFNLPDTNGNMHNLANFKGKVVYIDLWASWCGPCKLEMPFLKEMRLEYKDKNIQFISIAVKDEAGRKRRIQFINQLQLNWMQLEDQNDFVWNKYKITSIPRFILIDKEGRIIDFDAPRPSDKDVLRKAFNAALR